jgi:hypothetical protein
VVQNSGVNVVTNGVGQKAKLQNDYRLTQLKLQREDLRLICFAVISGDS